MKISGKMNKAIDKKKQHLKKKLREKCAQKLKSDFDFDEDERKSFKETAGSTFYFVYEIDKFYKGGDNSDN